MSGRLTMRHLLFSLSISVLLTLTSAAAARPRPERLFGPDVSVSLEPTSGMGSTTSVCDPSEGVDCAAAVVTLGAAVLARWSFLELGPQLETSASMFGGEGHTFWSGLAGVQTDGDTARFELLGELGVHSIEDIGTGFLEATPGGVDASMPFAGLRVGASARWGRGAARFVLGGWLAFRADLEHRERHVAQSDCLFGCTPVDRTYELGGNTTLLGIRLGVEVR